MRFPLTQNSVPYRFQKELKKKKIPLEEYATLGMTRSEKFRHTLASKSHLGVRTRRSTHNLHWGLNCRRYTLSLVHLRCCWVCWKSLDSTEDGIKYFDLSPGNGDVVVPGSTISVHSPSSCCPRISFLLTFYMQIAFDRAVLKSVPLSWSIMTTKEQSSTSNDSEDASQCLPVKIHCITKQPSFTIWYTQQAYFWRYFQLWRCILTLLTSRLMSSPLAPLGCLEATDQWLR